MPLLCLEHRDKTIRKARVRRLYELVASSPTQILTVRVAFTNLLREQFRPAFGSGQ
jgi:hypothetical protein